MGRRKSRRARLITIALLVAATLLVAHDVGSKPGEGIGARLAIVTIDEYRAHLSPRLARVTTCRFQPTCSAYGREAIARYGLLRGAGRTAWRIARCGPWTPMGTVDRP
ncbi:MAG TPA: membrane protein insertion efficiency factor YidD [Thermoanaerobaculia bacterium]|nr:membrane protein insertion efficiency factor YidD [Thermoanaerobaculia bacterium]